ncbi:MAG: OmpA family protein [Kofleriaceae bacterium]|nr:OmpA family protein [Kofleriaceae bacterium]
MTPLAARRPSWLGLAVAAAAIVAAAGCSLVTVEQAPFEPMHIRADRPPAPPPRLIITKSNIEIPEKIQFELGSDRVLEVSYPLLDEIARVLDDNPQIEAVEIAGHTDATGGAARNRELSQQRAEAVRQYLLGRGIAKDRLTARGYGEDKPIAPNDSPEGREANRRVEFVIVRQVDKKTAVPQE